MRSNKLPANEFQKVTGINFNINNTLKTEVKWCLIDMIRVYYGKPGYDDVIEQCIFALSFLNNSKNGASRLLSLGVIRFDNDKMNELFQEHIKKAPYSVTMRYYDERRAKNNRSQITSD